MPRPKVPQINIRTTEERRFALKALAVNLYQNGPLERPTIQALVESAVQEYGLRHVQFWTCSKCGQTFERDPDKGVEPSPASDVLANLWLCLACEPEEI